MRTILTTCLLVLFLASPVAAQELTGTLAQIKKSGTVRIGYRKTHPPMSFLDKDGKPAGYSIDLCGHIVTAVEKNLGGELKVEYVPMSAEERFEAIAGNRIDLLCGATTKTYSRSKVVDFTQLTFVTGASFMTLKGKDIRGNFDGKKIGVLEGTTTVDAVKKLFKEAGINASLVLLKSSAEGLSALEKGEIDAYSADQVVLIGLALSSDDPRQFSVLPNLFSYEPFALALRRNDADFRLVADRAISDLYKSKEILKIYDKWMGEFSPTRPTAFEALVTLSAIPE